MMEGRMQSSRVWIWRSEVCKLARDVIYCSSNSMCTTMNELTWGPTTPGGPGGPILPWKPCKTQTQLTVYLENTDAQIWKAKTCPLITIITVCDWDEEKSAVMTFLFIWHKTQIILLHKYRFKHLCALNFTDHYLNTSDRQKTAKLGGRHAVSGLD